MLPAHIIDRILEREREARRQDERPQPTLELPQNFPITAPAPVSEEGQRGVLIIEL